MMLMLRKLGFGPSSPLWTPCPFDRFDDEVLRNEIERNHTESKLMWPSKKIRIVICACGKDGKSSTINNILSALQGKYTQTADTGGQPSHITHKYIEYRMMIGKIADAKETPYLICDTPGISGDDEAELNLQMEAIKAAIMGTFKSGDMINYKNLTMENLGKMKPTREMAACVIFVIDSTRTKIKHTTEEINKLPTREVENTLAFEKMKSILRFVQQNDIKTACLLTKCDRLDGDVGKKLRNMYYSRQVELARCAVESSFNGFPNDRIFPIVNYTRSLEATQEMMVQSLFAMKYILDDIQSNLARRVDAPTN